MAQHQEMKAGCGSGGLPLQYNAAVAEKRAVEVGLGAWSLRSG
jgi:hypothetical protein